MLVLLIISLLLGLGSLALAIILWSKVRRLEERKPDQVVVTQPAQESATNDFGGAIHYDASKKALIVDTNLYVKGAVTANEIGG